MNKQKTILESMPENVPKGRAAKECHCGKWFVLPSCHADRHQSCSAECGKSLRERIKAELVSSLTRNCKFCDRVFVTRNWLVSVGHGAFCSISCSSKAFAKTEKGRVTRGLRLASLIANYASGKTPRPVRPKGEESPNWKGGIKASYKKAMELGKRKAYLAANPEKVREWSGRRTGKIRSLPKLPRGTIAQIKELQRGLCANCLVKLGSNYHKDHIVPIARGGEHERFNIQLLCPPCNLRKSARDPIVFAQMNGRLL